MLMLASLIETIPARPWSAAFSFSPHIKHRESPLIDVSLVRIMSASPDQQGTRQGLRVIHAGLYRTGTMSIARAYERLGYKTHHVSTVNPVKTPWVSVEHAAEATWPSIPGLDPSRPRPRYTRADWDAAWGEYDIVTDLVSPFAPQLIEAYPDAKVVVVQRDFDPWWASMQGTIFMFLDEPDAAIKRFVGGVLLGIRGGHAMRKILLGFFGVERKEDITEVVARAKYDEYYAQIRKMVPPERRLEYRLGDGWEPLCAFLGKDVPDEPFPRLNDTVAFGLLAQEAGKQIIQTRIKENAPRLLLVVVVLVAWFMYRRSTL
ncbi:uncharacterized protein B0I36DRAFT_325976 [Microdochium trichocladiopsis]|uniref:Efflux pump antibiotic resistance protein n=1 Tax=Microdochium trichocladiopsis TaxID=1682393 RepID=A0A9P9BPS6_9PEZI|nr:uncharacterized protein B0I36DRAFT_325976 [Microdochium trichocladiopsis]KAH7029547.1 hypothetical protein B0I36DRAFT_325976 [Microdochium trichocladiopsis]